MTTNSPQGPSLDSMVESRPDSIEPACSQFSQSAYENDPDFARDLKMAKYRGALKGATAFIAMGYMMHAGDKIIDSQARLDVRIRDIAMEPLNGAPLSEESQLSRIAELNSLKRQSDLLHAEAGALYSSAGKTSPIFLPAVLYGIYQVANNHDPSFFSLVQHPSSIGILTWSALMGLSSLAYLAKRHGWIGQNITANPAPSV